MAGEDLPAVELTERGVVGDRAFALVDRETGRVVSAKRPRLWPGILSWSARLIDESTDAPEVEITRPDGQVGSSVDHARVEALVSETFGRAVELARPPASGAIFQYHWPDQDGLTYHGRTYRDEITEHEMPPGTFFDSGIIHIVTTASLAAIGRMAPESRFEAGRFRANLVIDTGDATGFVENDWVGRVIGIGPDVRIRVLRPCIRCVMVNLEQPGIPADRGVLAAAFAHNDGNVGIKCDVISAGVARVGDPVTVS